MPIIIEPRFISPKITVQPPDGQAPEHRSIFTRGPVKAVASALSKQDVGVDDISQMSTQLAPLAGACVTAAFMPFVAMGAVHAVNDAHAQRTRRYPAAVSAAQEQNRAVEGYQLRDLNDGHEEPSKRLGYEESKLRRANVVRGIAKVDRNASLITAPGMVGLTAGLGLSLTESVAALAGANSAASVLGTVSGALLLPAQVVLATAATVQAVNGVREGRQIAQDGASIEATFHLATPAQQEALREHTARIAGHNRIGVGADVAKAIGQTTMAAGTIASLTVAGAPAGIPLAVTGAGVSIASAVIEGVNDARSARFSGSKPSPQAVQAAMRRDIGSRVDHHGLEGAATLSLADYDLDRKAVAHGKLLSLITHAIRHEKTLPGDVRPLAEQRRESVQKMVSTGHKGFFKRTTLLPSDLRHMQLLFDSRGYQADFFEGTRQDVLDRVRQRAMSHPLVQEVAEQQDTRDRIMKKAARHVASKGDEATRRWLMPAPGQKTRTISDVDWALERAGNPTLAEAHASVSAKVLSRQMKTDAKYLRSEARRDLADIGHAMGAMPAPRVIETPSSPPRSYSNSRSDSGESRPSALRPPIFARR